jgi:hypothetical protein
MKIYNFCLLFGFDRKDILKTIHSLIQQGYDYTSLVNMTLLEITDIGKVLVSLEQQETLSKAGF